jgi:phosphoglycerate dehydrogenase-like enzyme
MQPVVHVAPESDRAIEEAITAADGRIGPLEEADALVWLDSNPDSLPDTLPDGIRWVQLPSAGVENWLAKTDRERAWTSAAGAYGLPVAEHALALMLAGARRLADCARAESWTAPPARPLDGSRVAVVGAGGIGRALIGLLAPLDVEVLAVTRRGRNGTLPAARLHDILPAAHHVVVAAPATPDTRHVIGAAELEAMREDAWLVNVARGSLVDTDALVAALAAGSIAGAALDVTDPLITPHIANPPATLRRYLAAHVGENVRRFGRGDELLALIDADAGY